MAYRRFHLFYFFADSSLNSLGSWCRDSAALSSNLKHCTWCRTEQNKCAWRLLFITFLNTLITSSLSHVLSPSYNAFSSFWTRRKLYSGSIKPNLSFWQDNLHETGHAILLSQRSKCCALCTLDTFPQTFWNACSTCGAISDDAAGSAESTILSSVLNYTSSSSFVRHFIIPSSTILRCFPGND